jgi:hypothetical protein
MSAVYDWLIRAMDCSSEEVRLAAAVMKNYYRDALPMTAEEHEQEDKYVRRISRQHNAEEND